MNGIDLIKADLSKAATREEADAIMRSAHAAGHTFQELADIIGVTRQAIQQRMTLPVDVTLLRNYPPAVSFVKKVRKVTKAQLAFHESRKAKKRILGLKVSSPVMNVPVEQLNRLAELHGLVTVVRGWTPLDAPARLAIEPFGELLDQTIKEFEIPQTQLEAAFGLSRSAFTVWRRNHGYLPQMPSQKSYQGKLLDLTKGRGGGRKRLVIGGQCRKGHLITEETLATNGTTGNQTCRVCRSERLKASYQRKKELRAA